MHKETLLDQFFHLSQTRPDSVALQSETKKVSYAQLEKKVSQVSAFFRDQGVQVGDRVALVIDNSIDYVIAFYAIWKVGGVVVALNPLAKFYEIEKSICHCQAKYLLIDTLSIESIERLKELNIQLVSLSESVFSGVSHWQDAFSYGVDGNWYAARKSTLAQIIYTSGTTGNPKGVSLSHGNLMTNVKDVVSFLMLSADDSLLNVLPFHYSYGNSVLHTHLYVGAKIILAGSMAFPQEIINTMRELTVSGFSGVPSTYSLFLSHSDWSENPPPLRYLTQAGGPMGKDLTERLLAASNKQTKLFIMYGQTEASARITWLPPEALNTKLGSVGIPVKHIQLEIRSEENTRLDRYQKGEVFVAGSSVMQGYWDNAEATAEVLNGAWLKTGDLGYLDEDGYLFLIGRKSEMIKVGAHRIDPLELEEIINQPEFIQESAVIGIDDDILGQRLCVYIVGEKSKENLFALKKHCNEYLPTHKMPREIHWLPKLPKTASGKIKRYQLKN